MSNLTEAIRLQADQIDSLRQQLAAKERELEAEREKSDRHYAMAVAMFFSGKVDNITAGEIREAADKIRAVLTSAEAK